MLCTKEFKARDYKGNVCYECKVPRPCRCGCGEIASSALHPYRRGHRLRGKTYLEIYGPGIPACGFRRGKNNPNYDEEVKRGSTEKLLLYYRTHPEARASKFKSVRDRELREGRGTFRFRLKNDRDESFRSTLELKFADFLYSRGMNYLREYPIRMLNGHLKIVDFVFRDILIEITGFAYAEWQEDFIQKINILRASCTNSILILSYPEMLERFAEQFYRCCSRDIYVCSIENTDRILKTFQFIQDIQYANKMLADNETVQL